MDYKASSPEDYTMEIRKSISSQNLANYEQRNIILCHPNFDLFNNGERYVKVLSNEFSQKDTSLTFWIPAQDLEDLEDIKKLYTY